jgi:peptidyl-prolyl cis-trans isomerase B (cyclophilin B)
VSKANKRERQRQNRIARREYEEAIEKRKKFWRTARGFAIIAIPVLIIGVVIALRGGGDDTNGGNGNQSESKAPAMTIDPAKTYTAAVETSQGNFSIALDAANAPKSVNNFVSLARKGFYDGLDVFRVATDLFQTGSPKNEAVGGPGYTIKAELPTSSYEIGSVAWGKRGIDPPGTAGSQFFVVTGAGASGLPLDYGTIGKVSNGLEVLQKISALAPASGDGAPTTPVTMTNVTISES